MIKKAVISIFFLLAALYACGVIFEKLDDNRALSYAKQLSNTVVFNPEQDYSRINSVADQFTIPSYVWAKRKFLFHNGMWRYSKYYFVKLVTFVEPDQPRIVLIEFSNTTRFLQTQNQFSDPKIFPFTPIGSYSEVIDRISRGVEVRPTIVTGAPKIFPKDGMKVTPSLQFASQHANIKPDHWFQVSKLQLPLFATVFPVDSIYVYEK